MNKTMMMLTITSLILTGCQNPVESFSSSSSEHTEITSSENFSSSDGSTIPVSEEISSTTSETHQESSENMQESVEMSKAQVNYSNPRYTNGEFADPTGVYDEVSNTYWLFATGGRTLKSVDMVNWYPYGVAFNPLPNWGTPGAGLWAPDVTKVADKYVMYYSLSTWGDANPGIGVAYAYSPEGPWIDNGELFRSQAIGVNNSIDAHAFVTQENKVFLVWGSMRGNYIVELTSDGLNLKDGSVAEANKTKIRVAGLDTSVGWTVETYEGAYVLWHNGYYYLMLSKGTCCQGVNSTYNVVVGRSPTPTGPYLDNNGLDLRGRDRGKLMLKGNDAFFGPGHHTILQDREGDYWMYYHAFTKTSGNNRVLMMDKIIWDQQGWPYIENLEPSNSNLAGPIYLQ